MAAERYVIEFDAVGIPTITRNLKLMDAQAAKVTMTIRRLKKEMLGLAAIKMQNLVAPTRIAPVAPIPRNAVPKDLQPRIEATAASTKKLTLAMGHLGGQVRALATPLSVISKQTQVNAVSMSRLTAKANANAAAIARMKTAAHSAVPVFGRLSTMFGAFGALMATRKVIEYGDAWVSLSNKIRIVSNGEQDLINKRKALIDISNRSRSSLEGNVTLYQRLGLANRSLGKSDKELLGFTEAISKSLAISGATAQETRSVLIQLAQGLGSDAVRGEEFRAVMESGSRVMSALAEATGLTVGQLKQLTAEGKFLSVDFFDAVMSQVPAINRDFEKLTVTIGQASNVFRNNMVVWIGRMNEATGAGNKLGATMIKLSENLTTVGTVLVWIGLGALVGKLGGIQAMLVAMGKSTAILALNMIKVAAAAASIFLLASAAQTFFAETQKGSAILIAFGWYIESIRVQAVTLFEFLPKIANQTFANLKNAVSALANHIKNEFTVVGREMQKAIKFQWKDILSREEVNAAVAALDEEFQSGLIKPSEDAFADFTETLKTRLVDVADGFAAVRAESDAMNDGITPIGEKLLQGIEEDFARVTALFGSLGEMTTNPLDAIGDTSDSGGGGGEDGGFMESMRSFLHDITELGDEAWASVGRIADPETWAGLMDTMSDTVSVDTFFGGIAEGFQKASMSAESFKKSMVELTVNGIKGFSDELTLALTGGEADFKAFALSIIRQLISMMIQAMITAAIMAALGIPPGGAGAAGGGGGGGGGLAGLFGGKQFGGPVQAGQPTLVGERRPEIFVPQTAGRIEPRADGGGQQQAGPSIVNVVDEQMFQDAMASTEGEAIIMNVIKRNKTSLG